MAYRILFFTLAFPLISWAQDDIANRKAFMFDSQNPNLSKGFGYDLVDGSNRKVLNPQELLLTPESQELIELLPNSSPPFEYRTPMGDPTPNRLPKGVNQLMHFSHDALMMGGNITGGGEGVMYFDGIFDETRPDSELVKGCEPKGIVLADIAKVTAYYPETFEFTKTNPYLKLEFTDEELLFGAPIDIKTSAPRTYESLLKLFTLWESSNPLIVGLLRKKLDSMEFFTTDLPIVNPITDNAITQKLIGEINSRIQTCNERGLYKPTNTLAIHETIGSFAPHRGILISNATWKYLGDKSRQALIVHELLRSFQYEDQFPISNLKIRELTAVLIFVAADAPELSPQMLDGILLTHSIISLGHAFITNDDRLKMACGFNEGHEDWLSLHASDFDSFMELLDSLAKTFPLQEKANLLGNALEQKGADQLELEIQFRLALVYSHIVQKFPADDLRRLLESETRPFWFDLVDLKKLSRENFLLIVSNYKELYDSECQNPEFSTEAFTNLLGEEKINEMAEDEIPKIANQKQRSFLMLQDILFTVTKALLQNQIGTHKNQLHPNIYLPVEDHTIQGFWLRATQWAQNPNGFTQNTLIIDRLRSPNAPHRYMRLNRMFLEEFKKAELPPRSFRNQATGNSGI